MLVITDGQNCVHRTETGEIEIIPNEDWTGAEIYPSINKAVRVINSDPGMLENYYVYDFATEKICWNKKEKLKRKQYSESVRKLIYIHAGERCELCGRKILFSEMTLDHIIALSVGGVDDVENLQCTCMTCNKFKGSILPEEFNKRIADIYMYQMEKRNRGRIWWKVTRRVLVKMG